MSINLSEKDLKAMYLQLQRQLESYRAYLEKNEMEKQWLLMVIATVLMRHHEGQKTFIPDRDLNNEELNQYYLVFRSTEDEETGFAGTLIELARKDEWDEDVPEGDGGDSEYGGMPTNYIPRDKLDA